MSASAARNGRGSSRARGASQPRGARPPRPDLPWALLRVVIVCCLILVLGRNPLVHWAGTQIPVAAEPALVDEVLPELPAPEVVVAQALVWLLNPPVFSALRMLGVTLLVLIGAELTGVLSLMILQSLRQRGRAVQRSCYLVRIPRQGGTGGPRLLADPDQDLLRAIYGAIPAHGRWHGGAPWVAFTLLGRSDMPVELGFVVAGRNGNVNRRIEAAISNAIVGQVADALVEQQADPLCALIELPDQPAGGRSLQRVVVWREFGLKLPSEYPSRLLDDVEGSVLQGPLLAALRPRGGTVVTEAQFIVRPIRGRLGHALNRGWRARATALRLHLEGKADYALSMDTKAIEAKLAGAAYALTLRVIAVAEGADAAADARMTLDTVGDALQEYQARTSNKVQQFVGIGDGAIPVPEPVRRGGWPGVAQQINRFRLEVVYARSPRFAPLPHLLAPLRTWRDVDVFSSVELGGLWHLPVSSLAHLVRWLPNRHLPAPPHAFTEGNPARVVVGYARRGDGTEAPVGPTWHDLRQIGHLTAGMGAGKSRLMVNVAKQAVPHGLVQIDGKGDDKSGSLVAVTRQQIPLEAESRLVILDVLDAMWPIGLNPLSGVDLHQPGGPDLVLGQVQATFSRIDSATWGKSPGMQQYLQMATLLVLEGEQHPTLANVKQCLVDPPYRERLLKTATNIEVKTFWEVTFPSIGDQQKSSRDALLRRFDMLLTAETTRYLITQAQPTFDFLQAIESKYIVLVPLPDMTLGGIASAIGTLIFQACMRAAFSREGSDQTRHNYLLQVDEFQVLIGNGDPKDIETALTRLRALGIPTMYAHQALIQLGTLEEIMRINAALRWLLQTQEPDASTYARHYASSGITASDIAQQDPRDHQYVRLLCAGKPTDLMSIRPLMWPEPLSVDVPAYEGPHWQTCLPADSPDPGYDRYVLQMVYGHSDSLVELAQRLAVQLSEQDWVLLLARWDAIRLYQRAYILEHPGCIPDRFERQMWLSRLFAARPRLLAEVEYHRARPAITAVAPGKQTGGKPMRGTPNVVGGQDESGDENWSTAGKPREPMVPPPPPILPPQDRFLMD